MTEETAGRLVVFKGKRIRRVLHNGEWFFSVIDVIASLVESDNPSVYWSALKHREEKASGQPFTFCKRLKLQAQDGKMRGTDCANAEGIFRVIQSIPSPKAEPFKRWLARVGYERVQEIENPELASKRARALYKAKGYPDTWIEKRMRSIAIREELTQEWQKRGVEENREYAILTAEISKATFGLTPSEYSQVKGLKRQNLRDHMTDLELVFSMLGEASTTEIARNRDAQGFGENREAARDGGRIAGNARRELEKKSGRKVVSKDNFLPVKPDRKKITAKKKLSPKHASGRKSLK